MLSGTCFHRGEVMTQQDKREMFKANLQRAIFNAHKHGLSWKDLRDILTDYLKTFPLE